MSNLVELKNKLDEIKPEQQISDSGKIKIGKKGIALRILTLGGIGIAMSYSILLGIELNQPLVVFSAILPMHSFLVLFVGWFFYKNPATNGKAKNALVSVIVPVYNQKEMIRNVLEAILNSSYKKIEIIAVNDGSDDGSEKILDEMAKQYGTRLKVFHKKNSGKRRALANGFKIAKGDYFVLIDSDSIIDQNAIEEFVKAFSKDVKLGALVGHAKVWNSKKNILTKFQDVWYDYFFNIRKTTESTFGSVLCCSGCLAAYRRESLEQFIPYWAESPIHYGDDRELTSYALAPKWAKDQIASLYVHKNGKEISPLTKKTMKAMSEYDDAEDRALTAQAFIAWKTGYVASAIVYTDVPESWKIFIKQQKRWKKGTLRVNFFVSTFFWKKHPLMASIFYLDFMSMFSMPMIILTVFLYVPIVLHNFSLPLLYFAGMVLPGIAHGSDYKFRDCKSKTWMFKPLMDLLTTFVTSWLIFPAIWGFRKNEWLTR
ncbi:MAG: glycosyltransferase [Nitrosopumilus sp.]|nr:glycosyltransferase [Nitrosopumilus sp.]